MKNVMIALGLLLAIGCQPEKNTPLDMTNPHRNQRVGATCIAYQYEGAMAGPIRGRGKSWWYYYNTIGTSQTIFASQTLEAGTFVIDAAGRFSITLNEGWELKADATEPIRIQGYDTAPSSRPNFSRVGGASSYRGKMLTGTIAVPKPIYVAYLELQRCSEWDNTSGEIPGLVASYPFEGNADDVSGNNRHGVVTNATLTTGHKNDANSAYNFNGAMQRIDLGNWFDLQQFSISMWVKPGDFQFNPYAVIIDNNHSSISWVVQQDNFTTNNYYWGVSNSTSGPSILPVPVSSTQWTHVVLVKSDVAVSIYVNGTLTNTLPYSGSIVYNGSQQLCLGAWVANGSYQRYWNGQMDDLKIYNRPLDMTEVNTLFTQ